MSAALALVVDEEQSRPKPRLKLYLAARDGRILNTYSLRNIANGAELRPDQLEGQSVSYPANTFFPMLAKSEHHFYEGGEGDKYTWTSQVSTPKIGTGTVKSPG